MKLEELPPSIYTQYKDVAVKSVGATDTTFTVTVEGAKHTWRRKDGRWVRTVKDKA